MVCPACGGTDHQRSTHRLCKNRARSKACVPAIEDSMRPEPGVPATKAYAVLWQTAQLIKINLAPSPADKGGRQARVIHVPSSGGMCPDWLFTEIVRHFGPAEQRERLQKYHLCMSLPLPQEIKTRIADYLWAEKDPLAGKWIQRIRASNGAKLDGISASFQVRFGYNTNVEDVLRQVAKFEYGCNPEKDPHPTPSDAMIRLAYKEGDRAARLALSLPPVISLADTCDLILTCYGNLKLNHIRINNSYTVGDLMALCNSATWAGPYQAASVRVARLEYKKVVNSLTLKQVFSAIGNCIAFCPAAHLPPRNIRYPSLHLTNGSMIGTPLRSTIELLNTAPPTTIPYFRDRHRNKWVYQ